ncbi:PREDICTED: pentatricopeptide repeat-containing protein At2g22410, mitochondrial isoform X2 [Nelumbo nucifera]|uniref:Pentatricopeptide repeat-containing protein At2g22410, mitochondrial isoform X2 n=1 Tax=Nelumbo nucifera TaxID=4432 RepID=A0A1U8Q400_NELNU|nr:PREDICTED: pentatricopeptide repeat-containing protein At2g22410, mitochondrial isoform X2 [Nelumbo nucifera]
MIVFFLIKLRSLRGFPRPLSKCNPFVSCLHTRLVVPHKEKPSWNTNHIFVLTNPLLSLLERCKSMNQLKQIQAQMILTGLISDRLALSRLIAFCAISESGSLDYCNMILANTENPNVFSWNIAIRGHSESDNPKEAFLLYMQMLRNAIHMLVSCGDLEGARRLFDRSRIRDLVSWNSIINGYVRRGMPGQALELFREMKVGKIEPDEVTMIGMVSSCAQMEDLNLGREFHRYIEERGLKMTIPLSNALMDMYVKCGSLESAELLFNSMTHRTMVSWTTMVVGYVKFGHLDAARKLFDEMPEKDVVPWNAMISGYVQCNRRKEALALFHEMQAMNIKPDEVTMVSLLSACSQLGALDVGVWIHHYIEKHSIWINVALGTALVDMYAKCGNITKALQLFQEIPGRNALTWTAIIGALALHGHAQDAISYFLEMIDTGLVPDEVTFLGVLSACCHAGLVDEGRRFFTEMKSKFKISPKLKHYSCMVDLLGRAGFLHEAEELIDSMPMEPDAVVWGALFFACRTHGNVAMGEWAASKLLELDPHDSGIYVLLASMYVEANMWEKAGKVRVMMRERGVEKTPGCSSIEVNGIVYEFIVRDRSHPQTQEIYECLIQLARQLEIDDYVSGVPQINVSIDSLLFCSSLVTDAGIDSPYPGSFIRDLLGKEMNRGSMIIIT